MKPKKLLAVCGACAVTGAPAAAALAAGGPTPAALAPHNPVASALADRQAEHDVLRLARRKARVAHTRVGPGYVHRVQTWSPARLRRERRALPTTAPSPHARATPGTERAPESRS